MKWLRLWRLRHYAILNFHSVSSWWVFRVLRKWFNCFFWTCKMTISVVCLEAPCSEGSCHVDSSHLICTEDWSTFFCMAHEFFCWRVFPRSLKYWNIVCFCCISLLMATAVWISLDHPYNTSDVGYTQIYCVH